MGVFLALLVAGAGVALWAVARPGASGNGGMMTGMAGMMGGSSSGACPSQQGDAPSATIESFRFCPSPLRVQTGTTVTWTNDDNVAHTVTARSGPRFDSGTMAQGRSWSHRFEHPGTFRYYCTLHPWMQGTLEVTAG
jgi:plastocyanin